jgi:hypothetical protein
MMPTASAMCVLSYRFIVIALQQFADNPTLPRYAPVGPSCSYGTGVREVAWCYGAFRCFYRYKL